MSKCTPYPPPLWSWHPEPDPQQPEIIPSKTASFSARVSQSYNAMRAEELSLFEEEMANLFAIEFDENVSPLRQIRTAIADLQQHAVSLEEQNAYLQRDLADAQRALVETKKRYEEKLKRAAEVIRSYKVLSFGSRYAVRPDADPAAAYEEAEKRIAAFFEKQEG